MKRCYWDDLDEIVNYNLNPNDYVMITDAANYLRITQGELRSLERSKKKIKTYPNPFGSCLRCRLYKKEDLRQLFKDMYKDGTTNDSLR